MRTVYIEYLLAVTCLFAIISCSGKSHSDVQKNTIDTCVAEKQKNDAAWEQIYVGTPLHSEIAPDLMRTMKSVSVSIVHDTIIISKEYVAKFKFERISTTLCFDRYEGIGDFIHQYLAKLNINMEKEITVLDFSFYSNPIPIEYLMANTIIYIDNYLFVVYEQNYVLVYRKPGSPILEMKN